MYAAKYCQSYLERTVRLLYMRNGSVVRLPDNKRRRCILPSPSLVVRCSRAVATRSTTLERTTSLRSIDIGFSDCILDAAILLPSGEWAQLVTPWKQLLSLRDEAWKLNRHCRLRCVYLTHRADSSFKMGKKCRVRCPPDGALCYQVDIRCSNPVHG